MATKELTSNVLVGGRWYGPDYPKNKVTSEVLSLITNEAAFAPPSVGEAVNDPDGDRSVFYGDPDLTNVTAGASTEAGEPPPPTQRAAEGTPPDDPGGEVPDGSVEDVLAWVSTAPDADVARERAALALEVEQAKGEDARKTLVEPLEELLTR